MRDPLGGPPVDGEDAVALLDAAVAVRQGAGDHLVHLQGAWPWAGAWRGAWRGERERGRTALTHTHTHISNAEQSVEFACPTNIGRGQSHTHARAASHLVTWLGRSST